MNRKSRSKRRNSPGLPRTRAASSTEGASHLLGGGISETGVCTEEYMCLRSGKKCKATPTGSSRVRKRARTLTEASVLPQVATGVLEPVSTALECIKDDEALYVASQSVSGACAVCWRDFGSECPVPETATLPCKAAVTAGVEHIFCAGCLAEVCWQHHSAATLACQMGTLPPEGPQCPKCRETFLTVNLHKHSTLLGSSAGCAGAHMPDASAGSVYTRSILPVQSMHNPDFPQEISVHALMRQVGPKSTCASSCLNVLTADALYT